MSQKSSTFAAAMQYVVFDDMTQCTEQDVQRLLSIVPQWRCEQALRYKHVFGQWTCLKAWELWAELLHENGWKSETCSAWEYNEYGKPFWSRGPQFSLSHCKEAVAVAINEKPIGIDVESIRHYDPALVERTMNPAEQKQVTNAPNPAREFVRLWTQKEAVVKCIGTGIVDDLREVLNRHPLLEIQTLDYPHYVLSWAHE